MTEKAFERLARRALLDANRADWAPVLEGAGALAPEFSPRYRRRRLRLVNDPFSYAKKAARPAWKRAARTAACLLLAFALSFGALMAVSPEVRAWVQEVFIQWKSDHAAFRFGEDAGLDAELDTWRLSYLPEGYELAGVTGHYMVNVTYEKSGNASIFLTYSLADDQSVISVDNEHQDYSETVVNGNKAYLMTANEKGYMSTLVWVDNENNTAFCITSELSGKEMIKMAESIEKVN